MKTIPPTQSCPKWQANVCGKRFVVSEIEFISLIRRTCKQTTETFIHQEKKIYAEKSFIPQHNIMAATENRKNKIHTPSRCCSWFSDSLLCSCKVECVIGVKYSRYGLKMQCYLWKTSLKKRHQKSKLHRYWRTKVRLMWVHYVHYLWVMIVDMFTSVNVTALILGYTAFTLKK